MVMLVRRAPRRAAAAILALAVVFGLSGPQGYGESTIEGSERPSEIVFGTFNIHYVAPGQTRLAWENRREAVVAALREGGADIQAFQEMETFAGGHWNDTNVQLDWVRRHFPEYAVAAVGNPREYPSTQAVFYRRARFEALEQGFFFFSPHPDEPYSRPWRGRFPAFCSWVRLHDRISGMGLYVYNVHFDHSSRENRIRSARLVAERLETRRHGEDPVVILGDFNSPKSFRPVSIVLEQGLTAAQTKGSTFHFHRGLNLLPAIDHVLYSGEFRYVGTRVLRSRFEGVWPGDHYPVFVTLRLTAGG